MPNPKKVFDQVVSSLGGLRPGEPTILKKPVDSADWTGRETEDWKGLTEADKRREEQVRKELGLDDNVEVRFVASDKESIAALRSILKGFTEEPVKQDGAAAKPFSERDQEVADITYEVFEEALHAIDKYPSFVGPEKALRVLRQKFVELWLEGQRDCGFTSSARKRAIQVAVVAVRYVLDLDPDNDRV